MKDLSKKRGFSLVEISVSLAIIGVLLGGVLTTTNILQTSKLRVVIKEFNENITAFNRFQEKFKYWPGDIPIASTYWGTTNGNGDFSISWNTEGYYAWDELSKTKFVKGSFAGLSGANLPGKNVPMSLYDNNAGYHFTTNYLWLGKSRSADRTVTSIFSPRDAQYLDSKVDDGMPQTGYYRADYSYLTSTGGSWTAANCISAVSAAGTYLINSSTIGCTMYYILSGQ